MASGTLHLTILMVARVSELFVMILNSRLCLCPYFLECQCDRKGILLSDGCNQETGACSCKRNVIGRDCNQCRPQHYGLSLEDELGCQPCDCDIGGAHDNNCDIITGQCTCRPNIEGRRYSWYCGSSK